jgi:hypothetical protein
MIAIYFKESENEICVLKKLIYFKVLNTYLIFLIEILLGSNTT